MVGKLNQFYLVWLHVGFVCEEKVGGFLVEVKYISLILYMAFK